MWVLPAGFGNASKTLTASLTLISHIRTVLSAEELANMHPPQVQNEFTLPVTAGD